MPDTTLIQDQDGNWDGLVNGGDLAYNPADSLNFGGVYYLTTKDGLAYTIDANTGQVNAISDANGNELNVHGLEHQQQSAVSKSRSTATHRDGSSRRPTRWETRSSTSTTPTATWPPSRTETANVTQFVYNQPGRPHFLTQVIDPLGRQGVRTEYDDPGPADHPDRRGRQDRSACSRPDRRHRDGYRRARQPDHYEYDSRGNVIEEVDAEGGITTETYDDANNMLTETDPLGHTTTLHLRRLRQRSDDDRPDGQRDHQHVHDVAAPRSSTSIRGAGPSACWPPRPTRWATRRRTPTTARATSSPRPMRPATPRSTHMTRPATRRRSPMRRGTSRRSSTTAPAT